jgi:hypothetical protein
MFKNSTLLISLMLIFAVNANAQQDIDIHGIKLEQLAVQIQVDTIVQDRFKADSIFTKALVNTLKANNAFDFSFDSLHAIKQVVSPDNKFKIFSWQIDLGDGTYRQRAAIQFPTANGQLKLLPLFDQSDFILNTAVGISDRKHWIGAIYYDIIPVQFQGETVYTLLGFDEYTNGISRKIIEVMKLVNNEPIFGGDYFSYPKDPCFPLAPADRFVYQYKKGSNAIIKYDAIKKAIVVSELTSIEKDLNNPSTLVPSGNDLYFNWMNGKWTLSKF